MVCDATVLSRHKNVSIEFFSSASATASSATIIGRAIPPSRRYFLSTFSRISVNRRRIQGLFSWQMYS